MVRVGAIARPHGVRGALAVNVDDPDGTILWDVEEVHLASSEEGPARPYAVLHVARGRRGQVVLTLEGVDRPEAAEALRGQWVLVPPEKLPPLEPGEFRHRELLEMTVVAPDGRELGRVVEVVDTAEVAVLVVRGGGPERFLPFARPYVISVDAAARRIVAEPPPVES